MQVTLSLNIPAQHVLSDIAIQKGLFQHTHWLDELRTIAKRSVLITDDKVRDLFAHQIFKALKKHGFEAYLFSVPSGEQTKTRQSKEWLEDQLSAAGLGRDTVIVAVGGGMITDLAGFVAATYCRGLPFVSVPTTLLGQVDASLGGKVAINTPYGKNFIGALHHPRWIWIDQDALVTLPKTEILNGAAEIIKYALIASKNLFQQLKLKTPLEQLIEQSCWIKQNVVEKDPQEKGFRRILNFGHTIAHALETLTNYQLSHGQAVAIGMWVEAHLSCRLGYLANEELVSITELLEEFGFSLQLPCGVTVQDMMQVMTRDKKALLGQARFVLLKTIGETMSFDGAYCTPVKEQIVKEVLACLSSK